MYWVNLHVYEPICWVFEALHQEPGAKEKDYHTYSLLYHTSTWKFILSFIFFPLDDLHGGER